MALSAYPSLYWRRRVTLCALALCLMGLIGAGAWLAGNARAQALWHEVNSRSANELIRYAERRLQGHPRLERWLLPPLGALRARVEPEPPAGPLPTLGKGQSAQASAPHPGLVHSRRVDSPQGIREALLQATPGTQIVVAPGLYPFDATLTLGQDGRAEAPIALRAERPASVWFAFSQVDGIRVDRPHWVFENLGIRGACARHADCEHAFHVVGRGRHLTLRNNHLSDFNAPVKVNGRDGEWPDAGTLAGNTLGNSGPRETDHPVVMFDLVGAHGWQVHDNLISQFVKSQGNRVAYGLFAKGASQGARFERNLVVCTPSGISQPGERVGIALGGRTDPSVCRDQSCQAYEHRGGLAANNVVAHCNDAGLDVNQGHGVRLVHNTLINTAGITVRAGSSAQLLDNLVQGRVWRRDGSSVDEWNTAPLARWLEPAPAQSLIWHWRSPAQVGASFPGTWADDFNGKLRHRHYTPGALLN